MPAGFDPFSVDLNSLMSQDQCISLINQVTNSNKTIGWFIIGLAVLTVLLSFLLILQQKEIMKLEKKRGKK